MSSNAKPAYDPADLLLFQIVHDVRALVRRTQTRTQFLHSRIESHCDAETLAIFDDVLASQRDLDRLMVRLAAYAEAGRAASTDWIALDIAILGAKLPLKNALEQAGAEIAASGTAGIRVPSALQGVLAELFTNSLRFDDPNRPPRISISASAIIAGDAVRIRVKDNGRGWNPQHSERMFEPLQKLEASPEGFGLGLAIARRAVEGVGGRVWAESDATGGTIVIELPRGVGSSSD